MTASYFTFIDNNSMSMQFLYNANAGTTLTVHSNGLNIVSVSDCGGKNTLKFYMVGVEIGAQVMVCEMCRYIAMSANGKVRDLVEDTRVLLLMKQYSLSEIYHVSTDDTRSRGTLWTPDDAYAMMGE